MDDMLDVMDGDDDTPWELVLFEVFEHCVIPVLQQILHRLLPVLCVTFFVGELLQQGYTGKAANIICLVSGLIVLRSFVDEREALVFVIFTATTYFWIYLSVMYRRRTCYSCCFAISILYLIVREHYPLFGYSQWSEARGITMIALMKTMSLIYELTGNERLVVPNADEYFGYIWFPGSLPFGPWVSFAEHSTILDHTGWQKNYFRWSISMWWKLMSAVCCLLMSTCGFHYIRQFMEIESIYGALYFDAITTRFSHYFICHLSEAVYMLCGPRTSESCLSSPVVSPMHIEFPRSLVDVVVHWNIPMHRWLKRHIYIPLRAEGVGTTIAAIATFLVSAMLHGLSIHLTAVLVSIAIFSYIEYSFRELLTTLFDSCVRVRPCVGCDHKYRSSQLLVQLSNFGLYLLAMFNLAYLGALLDEGQTSKNAEIVSLTDLTNQFERWEEAEFTSHRIMLGLFLFTVLTRSLLLAIDSSRT